jgi:hypothetical protein
MVRSSGRLVFKFIDGRAELLKAAYSGRCDQLVRELEHSNWCS